MAQQMVWKPVEDGERIEISSTGDSVGIARPSAVHVRGNGRIAIEMTSLSMAGVGRYLHSGKMPTGTTVCELVPADAPGALTVVMTPEIRETLRDIIIHVQRRYPEAPKQADWAEALAYLDSLKGATE